MENPNTMLNEKLRFFELHALHNPSLSPNAWSLSPDTLQELS